MDARKLCALALLPCLLLAGCGGGDGRDYDPDRSLAQGVYDGTIVYFNGPDVQLNQQTIVLETGEFFIVYGATRDDVYFVDGVQNGSGRIELGTNRFFADNNVNDYFFDRDSNSINAVYNGDLRANFSSGGFFNGSASLPDSRAEFVGTVPATAVYNYNTAADLASISGGWNALDLLGNALAFSIDASGNLVGNYPSGCQFSGTLTPRASGKNVFNVSISFGSTPCPQPNLTFNGVAIDYALAAPSRALVIAGTTSDRFNGTALYGTR